MNSFHCYDITNPRDVNPSYEVSEYLVLFYDNHNFCRFEFFEQHFLVGQTLVFLVKSVV